MNEKVNFFFEADSKWHDCYALLRKLLLSSGLTETLKWGVPCYTLGKENVVLMHGFKDYCALLFFKGAVMPDNRKLLIQQTANVQAGRQLRFTDTASLQMQMDVISEYVTTAIQVAVDGIKVPKSANVHLKMQDELVAALEESPELHAAFYALTPGRQRGYILYLEKAKQSNTRIARIEKYRNNILAGKGVDE